VDLLAQRPVALIEGRQGRELLGEQGRTGPDGGLGHDISREEPQWGLLLGI